jgi:DNA-directed RNA polymerase I and III subunit RPAC1
MPRKSKHVEVKAEDTNALPPHLEDQRTRVTVGAKLPTNTNTFDHHGVFDSIGFDNSFDFEAWKEGFTFQIKSLSEEEIVFDLIGVDAPIANALRRVLISEVPTMAIETVYILNNTSIIPDEVLAHRLGLIPILADPRSFEYRKPNGEMTDTDTIVFELHVKCERIPTGKEGDPEEKRFKHSRVMSSDLEWKPQGDQDETWAHAPLRPVYLDIPIAKLRPGQEIHLTAFCEKNIGKEHAKWSPVATATYRLMPAISFKQEVSGDLARELVSKCPMNVFDIEDGHAIVSQPRNCTMCRECIREPEWDARVLLQKEKQHFIFSVESVGIIPPEVIVEEALKMLLQRIATVADAFEELKNPRTLPAGVSQLTMESEL